MFDCQAQFGEISRRHQLANPVFSTNMISHTVVGWHLRERYTQTKSALIRC